MDLLQAMQAPVLVGYGKGFNLFIPKFDMDDIIELGTIIKDQRVRSQTGHMEDAEKNQFLAYYPPLPPDMQEIKRYVRTPEGMVYVMRKKLPLAVVRPEQEGEERPLSGEEVDRICKLAPGKLGPLAWAVADIEENAIVGPQVGKKDEKDKNEGNR